MGPLTGIFHGQGVRIYNLVTLCSMSKGLEVNIITVLYHV
jgi:hypothetical protein